MTEDLILNLGQETLKVTAMIASPMLVGALVTGLAISVFQAITQINEATLTFIPKMAIVAIVIVIAGPWMVDTLTEFATGLFENITEYVRQ
jgi:flagellar biosynthesis protein FliQ